MPPNLKTSSVRNDVVRTDFVLKNVFAYLLGDHHNFDVISAVNKKEKDVLEDMIETLNAFKDSYLSVMKNLFAEIDVITEDNVESILSGVSNELFSEGITWSRIIAFFVFVGELTIMCITKNLQKSIVNVIYECFSRMVNEKLETWVQDHDGWEGITSLSVVAHEEYSLKMSNPSWAKSLLHTTVRMIGTLAYIANAPNDCF